MLLLLAEPVEYPRVVYISKFYLSGFAMSLQIKRLERYAVFDTDALYIGRLPGTVQQGLSHKKHLIGVRLDTRSTFKCLRELFGLHVFCIISVTFLK